MSDDKPTRLGRYELRDVIGQGAMGVVYRAYDAFLDRIVAVKTYRRDISYQKEARDRFDREVRTASRLSHSNIVVVYDGGVENDIPYLAMEFVDGPTLAEEITRRGRLSRDESLAILFTICDALAYAHGRGVVHRDLKPANILIAPGGEPKISDFGVAKLIDADTSAKTQTIGTPGHMAPEQIEGRSIGPATDVFALAILAYELLTGVRPFVAPTAIAMAFQVLRVDPKPASEVEPALPKALDGVLARALAKEPTARTPDATTFARELRLAFMPETARTVVAPQKSRAGTWAVIGVLTLVTSMLVFARYRRVRETIEEHPPTEPTPAIVAAAPPPPAAVATATTPPALPPVVAPVVVAPPVAVVPTSEPTAAATAVPTSEPTAVPRPTATPLTHPQARPTHMAPAEVATTPPHSPGAVVSVTTDPPNAEVRINGEYKGLTPLRAGNLGSGEITVEIRKPDYATFSKTLRVERGSEYMIRAPLAPEGRDNGYIDVASDPPGAKITIDGTASGQTPLRLGPLRPGPYQVTAAFPGFPPETQKIQMKSGELHKLNFIFHYQSAPFTPRSP